MTEKTVRLPLLIDAAPYLQDHRFEGKAVFPAVEAMRVLAQAVKEFAPQTDVTAATDAAFNKFLLIPSGTPNIDALCRITSFENGDITAVLQTKTRAGNAAFSRIKEHVSVHYPRVRPEVEAVFHKPRLFEKNSCMKISPEQIYFELVPFGPAYHNISEDLTIHRNGAIARLHAPTIGGAIDKIGPLGSPFILDAAFHSACVWSQRYGGVVAFPVAVEKRIIVQPTRPGNTYVSSAIPLGTDADRLIFNIFIYGEDNTLCELAGGVHMRDVSAGRLKPPAWIVEAEGNDRQRAIPEQPE